MQRLMLIDDDDNFVSIFTRFFKAGRYEVSAPRTVDEALAQWVKSPADLVIARARIMVEAGPRVAGAILRQAAQVGSPILATGTWSEETLIENARGVWARDSFSRPCHPEKIWDMIRGLIGHVPSPHVKIDLSRFGPPKVKHASKIEIPDEVLDDIVFLMYEVSGNLVKTRERLVNQVEKRMRDLDIGDVADYDRLLRTDHSELSNLVNIVTVNETYFFRNPEQFDALRYQGLGELTGDRPDKVLKVWSAACSLGAEPYSLAMLLRETLPDHRIEMLASDIDGNAIESARIGAFGDYMVGRTPREYRFMFDRHVKLNGDGRHRVSEAVKDRVTFRRENILEARYSGFDLVFCRNVMIYFDQQNIRKMMAVLAGALRVGGVLAVGDSEYMACEMPELERVRWGRSTFFRKVEPAGVEEQPGRRKR